MSRNEAVQRRGRKEGRELLSSKAEEKSSLGRRTLSASLKLYRFLYRGEPDDPKMLQWRHPVVAASSAMLIFVIVLHFAERYILTNAWLSPIDQGACPPHLYHHLDSCRQAAHWRFGGADGSMDASTSLRNKMATYIMGYYLFILGIRIWALGPQNVYEALWGCNMGLFLFSIALIWNRPLWCSGIAFALSIDQMLWYVDVLSYAYNRSFVIGVAEYLVWTETHIFKKVTCSHHLWFTPLICYCLSTMRPSTGNVFPFKATVALGLCIELLLVSIPRFYLPAMALWPAETALNKEELKTAPRDGNNRPLKMMYLNVNLSHSGWKDIKVLPCILSPQWFRNDRAILYIPYQNLVWAVVNCLLCVPLFVLL